MPFKTYSDSFGLDPDVIKAVHANMTKYKWTAGNFRRGDCHCFIGMVLDLNGTPPPDSAEVDRLMNTGKIDDYHKAQELCRVRGQCWNEAVRIFGSWFDKIYVRNDASHTKSYAEAFHFLETL